MDKGCVHHRQNTHGVLLFQDELNKRRKELCDQGQNWSNLKGNITFKIPTPLFNQPMEISINILRGLRMVC